MFYIYADGKSIYQPPDEALTLISPKLTLEIGKAGSLEFQVPPTHRFYNELRQLKTEITVELDDVEIFRGRVLSNERDFNNIRTVYCEGNLAYLVDSVQKGKKFSGTTHELFRKIIERHNARMDPDKQFTVGMITIEDREIVLTGKSDEDEDIKTEDFDYKQIAIDSVVDNWETSYDYIESCIIEYCGGYLRTRREGNVTYIDLVENYGNKAPQEIEFGVNMLDLKEEVSAEDLFTVLIPLGDDNLTIKSVNNGSDELVDEAGVEAYGRIVRTEVFGNVNKPETLLENGKRFLESHANIPITITIDAVDMHLVDSRVKEIYVGDIVHVNSMPHGLVEDLTCTKVEYDIENPANNVYTFGNPKPTLTERYREDKSKEKKKMSGGGGGGGGVAAGAAGGVGEAVEEAAEEKTNQLLDKFFDAWINVDKEAGHIDLGAIYRELKNAKTVLENQVGIDLDAPSGNINLHSLSDKYDELGNIQRQQKATIDILANDTKSQIELLTSWCEGQDENLASITLRTDANESAIEMKADKVTVESMNLNLTSIASNVDLLKKGLDGVQQNYGSVLEVIDEHGKKLGTMSATITTLATETESKIELATEDLNGKIASLTLITDEHGTAINAKADKVTVESMNLNMVSMATTLDLLEKGLDGVQQNYGSVLEVIDEHGKKLGTMSATITTLATETESKIELATKDLNGKIASLTLITNEQGTAINAKADKVTVESMNLNMVSMATTLDLLEKGLDGVQQNYGSVLEVIDEHGKELGTMSATITTLATETESKIELATKDLNDKMATLELSVQNNQSKIKAHADKIELLGDQDVTINSKITKINSDITTVKNLVAKKLTADELASKIGDIATLSVQNIINNGSLHTTGSANFLGNVQIGGLLTVNGLQLATKQDIGGMATQSWVKEYLKTFTIAWGNVTGKPAYYTPLKHRHSIPTTSTKSGGVSTNATHKLTINGTTYSLANGHMHDYDKPDSYTGYSGGTN